MQPSLKNFMSGIIDYAGLFPPAGLDMTTTLANFADYMAGESGWMLGRCILPANQLRQVGLHPGFCYSVIVCSELTEEELEQLSIFSRQHRGVKMVETKLPDSMDSPEACADHLLHLKAKLNRAELQNVQLFLETGNLVSTATLASSLAAFNTQREGGKIISRAGCKIRCGGQTKEDFPTLAQVAEAIAICRRQDIPIKFTAGLHQPLPHYSPDLQVLQHGFINIFAAALLSWSCDLSIEQIAACLDEEKAHHFDFTKEGLSWHGHTISTGEIKRLRQRKVISFGSCSFSEPVAGLRSLTCF